MTIVENREIALKLLAGIEAGSLDESVFTDDVSWWVPGRGAVDKAEFMSMFATFQKALAGPFSLKVTGVTAEGDRLAVEAESFGKLVNGKTYNNFYHFLFLFRDGKIYYTKEYNDSQHVADVLGGLI